MSIWIEVMPVLGAGHLEVHVAEVIFGAEDVGQDRDLSPSLISPIATPATAARIGTPASISASEPPQTVAIDDEPFDSRMSDTTRMRVRELLEVPAARLQRPLGQIAVADLAAAGAAHRATSPVENGGKL